MSTPTQPGSNRFQHLVESFCRSLGENRAPNVEDVRQLFTQIQINIQANAPGGNWVVPGGPTASGRSAPSGVGFSVSAANGIFTATITNPSGQSGMTIWHEISYSTVRSFQGQVTTMPPTAGTSVTIPAPGTSYFFRLRSSYDLTNWSSYQLAANAAISSGLVSSAATSEAGAFNQTNYAVVTSAALGGTGVISVQGANGAFTAPVTQKGPTQKTLPGATLVGYPLGSDQFVGWNGSSYVVRSTLAGVLSDDGVTPIGQVSVVAGGVPALPVITPILSGGHIIGATWTGDNGLTAPPVLTVTDPGGPGTDAVLICTGVTAGKMDGIQVLNPGQLYDASTVITPSGGIGSGTPGGGTAEGGNGGRLVGGSSGAAGPPGSTGPAGPAGPAGPPGPTERWIFGEQVGGGPTAWVLANMPAVDSNGNPAVRLYSGAAVINRGALPLDYTLAPSSTAITTNYAITVGTLWADYELA